MLSARRQKFAGLEKAAGRNLSFISANAWTAVSVIFGLIAAYFIATHSFLLGAFTFLIAALCDAVDGAVARHRKTAGSRGAYMDTVVDRYVEFFIIAGLFVAALPAASLDARLWLLLYLFGSTMTTYAKAAAREKGLVAQEMRGGIMERAERMALLFIGLALAAANPVYLTYVLVLLAILTNITALQRIARAFKREKG